MGNRAFFRPVATSNRKVYEQWLLISMGYTHPTVRKPVTNPFFV